ncbi:MAG: hypothetical protein LKI42_00120 [Bacteroidales bacterium]|jgi:hypothetical protein|nr:hypothetical protein [Bacteroidales bacterium]MCI1785666.1 hypothetical protein [Bacteroidales bacterium]
MKKVFISVVILLGLSVVLSAQPKAIGGRFGYGMEASYEHYFGKPHFLEVNAGIFDPNDVGFRLTGIYNYVFAQPDWTTNGQWSWYAGPGVSLGSAYYNDNNNFFFGVVGQIGLEYQFWFPLQLSADFRPVFGVCDGEFYRDGFLDGFFPTISVRYLF